MFKFLSRPGFRWLTLFLLLQICGYYAYPTTERRPPSRPFNEIPLEYKGWRMIQESQLDTEVQELLKADESVNRVYVNAGSAQVSLFVAFFATQRTGVAPHSPKVCLPGAGWVPTHSGRIQIPMEGQKPITVNRYVVAKGEQRSLVLYWYQTPFRSVANEYLAKDYTVVDGLRYRRSDTSLVRVIVSSDETHLEQAEQLAVGFAQDFYPRIKEHFPVQ